MKGIILAGGAGTRLYPLTKVVSKQLLPVYEKPMIYYSLSTLMLCGINEILIITTPWDLPSFEKILGDGSQLGLKLQYKIQEQPNGLPEAFTIGESFINGEKVALVLGDNLFYGDFHGFRGAVSEVEEGTFSAKTFAYKVIDPERYGVVEFNPENRQVLSIEEKPSKPKSNYAIPGFYIFDGSVCEKAKKLKPSVRGETEIIDLLKLYLEEGSLGVEPISRGIAWLDTGTPKSLLEASSFIGAIEQRQGLKVACIEEIALRMGFVDKTGFKKVIESTPAGPYRQYLQAMLEE